MIKKALFLKNSKRGEFSVKGLAITVGAVIVIGAVATYLSQGPVAGWIEQAWDGLWSWIQSSFMI